MFKPITLNIHDLERIKIALDNTLGDRWLTYMADAPFDITDPTHWQEGIRHTRHKVGVLLAEERIRSLSPDDLEKVLRVML